MDTEETNKQSVAVERIKTVIDRIKTTNKENRNKNRVDREHTGGIVEEWRNEVREEKEFEKDNENKRRRLNDRKDEGLENWSLVNKPVDENNQSIGVRDRMLSSDKNGSMNNYDS